MEDLSTIIWAVVIIGAMIFNSVAKARRARAKGEQAAPQHGEAWPAMPREEKAASAGSEPAPQPARSAREVRKQEPDARHTPSAEAFPGSIPPNRETGTAQSVSADFTGHARASEGDPATAHKMEPNSPQTAVPGDPGLRTQPYGHNRTSEKRDESEKDRRQAEASAREIAEEFDLRRAVIYAEILKPKFEE